MSTTKSQLKPQTNLNTTMLLMQCIGIVAVVFGHIDIGGKNIPNFLTLAFPYYSWHMPFFVFISGYFFNRSKPAPKYILQKLKTHLLPAFLVNLGCGIISYALKEFNITNYGQPITWRSLFITPFTTGYQFYINVSLWFIFCLVTIEIVACILDRITFKKCDLLFLVLSLVVALFCCYKAFYDHEGTREEYLNAALRFGYLSFFFWLGTCYKKYAEKLIQKFLNYKVSIIIFAIVAAYMGFTKYVITTNVRDMRYNSITVPNGFWVPVVSPIIATLFFLGICYTLAPYFKNNKTLAAYGRSTKYVMYYHQLIFVLGSVYLGSLIKLDIVSLESFSFKKMQNSAYYTGNSPALSMVFAIVALIIPVMLCRFVDKQKWWIKYPIYIVLLGLIVTSLYLCGRILN